MKSLPMYGLVILPLAAVIYVTWSAVTGTFDWFYLALALIFGFVTEYGVTLGYHRMVVHKSFEPHPALKALILWLGSMAFQGPVTHWASVHTKHHAYSDQEGDPHSPTISGFFYAHFEWLIEMNSTELGEIKAKWGARYFRDPMIVWFSNTFLFWSVFSLVLPAIIGYFHAGWGGAWLGFVWGGLVRIFITSHVTWSVNSVCHYFGNRTYITTDKSRNNPIVGILALGEGWHNNHHAFPASAFHGLTWWQFDFTGLTIRFYEIVGLAKKVTRIPDSLLEKRRLDSLASTLNVQDLAMTEEEEQEQLQEAA